MPGAIYQPTAGVNTVGILPQNCGGTGTAAVPIDNCRLYLVSGSPYADGSSTGNGIVYFGPCSNLGQLLTLDNGSGVLSTYTVSEISLSLATGYVSTNVYDVYVFNNSGTLTLATTVWTNATTPPTRGTDAAGRLTKSGSTNYLLVGAIELTSTTQTMDWVGARVVSNIYNLVIKPVQAIDTSSSWTYATATVRAANANTTNGQGRFSFLQVIQQNAVSAQLITSYTAANNGTTVVGIGIDSTSTLTIASGAQIAAAQNFMNSSVSYTNAYLGYHYWQRCEYATGGTTTFYGNTTGPTATYSALTGIVLN